MSEEILEKLDKLAVHCMMMDDKLGDLMQIAEASQKIDELRDIFSKSDNPEFCAIFKGLSKVFEKYILGYGEAGKGPEVIKLTNEGVEITKNVLQGTSIISDILPRVEVLIGSFKELFSIEIPFAKSKPEVEPATVSLDMNIEDLTASMLKEASQDADKVKGKKVTRTEITLLDENDVVIYEGFLDEGTDLLNKIESDLIALEENTGNMDILNSLFRAFHSLKGAAGFLGMNEINYFCHETENMLDQARKSILTVDSEVIDILLAARDMLEKGLTAISETVEVGKKKLPNFKGFCESINVEPLVDLIDKKLFLASKEADDDDDTNPRLGEILIQENAVTPRQLKEALERKEKPIGEVLVEMGATSKQAVDKAVQEQLIKKKGVVAHSVKVDTSKLNLVLELVGELVIAQAIISENQVLKNEQNNKLLKDINEMAKITNGIQDQIMGLRMVPLKQTFSKMNRLVRDLARKTGKQVDFLIEGEDTEIDRTIVDELNDPLVHLLRNAVDHGIDSIEERVAVGKSPNGTILLKAYHKGGNVVIEVQDNGRGLNLERIKEKALERGLIESGREYSEAEITSLIFEAGLSTQKVATEISGRGVGMDVVKRNVEKLGGKVDVTTKSGVGSTFFIKLPLTMAIVDGMLVRVGDERYIIPTISIAESIRPTKSQLTTVVEKGEMVNVRGELIPLVRLNRLFGCSNGNKDVTESLVIVVATESKRKGFLVDDLLGQQQVVIKNLDRRLQGIKSFSGSSILGDGLVGLIIDVGGVFDLVSS
ncbi:MAG: chemotaxis protein CheA [Nitrospinota bacterium]|nr:chemotaxis protein CheA [Nitrospinota bacterium]